MHTCIKQTYQNLKQLPETHYTRQGIMTTTEVDHHSEETTTATTGLTQETEDLHQPTETTATTAGTTTEHRATTDQEDPHHRATEQGPRYQKMLVQKWNQKSRH